MLVIGAVVCAAVALICAVTPAVLVPAGLTYSSLAPGNFATGLADLVRTPAITFALACAVGAVFVRALTWTRHPHKAHRFRSSREL